MKRGDVVTVATGVGFGGKPRPALIVQSDAYVTLTTVVVALLTSDLADTPITRPHFLPDATNGLREPSNLMIDVLVTARRDKVGKVIGRFGAAEMARAEGALLVFLGVAG